MAYCTLVQATSRDRLANAARVVLGARGYDLATVREIATEAGVPQGLIHYYFGGKDGLLAEVLIREAAVYRDDQDRATRAAATSKDVIREALDRRRRRVARDAEWHRLRFELFALGLRKPDMKPRLAELLSVGRTAIAEILAKADGPEPRSDSAMASVVLACVDGLALQKLADPTFDLEAAYTSLQQLIEEAIP